MRETICIKVVDTKSKKIFKIVKFVVFKVKNDKFIKK